MVSYAPVRRLRVSAHAVERYALRKYGLKATIWEIERDRPEIKHEMYQKVHLQARCLPAYAHAAMRRISRSARSERDQQLVNQGRLRYLNVPDDDAIFVVVGDEVRTSVIGDQAFFEKLDWLAQTSGASNDVLSSGMAWTEHLQAAPTAFPEQVGRLWQALPVPKRVECWPLEARDPDGMPYRARAWYRALQIGQRLLAVPDRRCRIYCTPMHEDVVWTLIPKGCRPEVVTLDLDRRLHATVTRSRKGNVTGLTARIAEELFPWILNPDLNLFEMVIAERADLNWLLSILEGVLQGRSSRRVAHLNEHDGCRINLNGAASEISTWFTPYSLHRAMKDL